MLKERIKRVLDSMTKKSYLRWYQKAGLVSTLEYRGVRILKFVPDLWNYQEIILQYKITNVIEFGSKFGGSAIYFADILKLFGTGGKVLCVDINDRFAPETDRPPSQSPGCVTRTPGYLQGKHRWQLAKPYAQAAIQDKDVCRCQIPNARAYPGRYHRRPGFRTCACRDWRSQRQLQLLHLFASAFRAAHNLSPWCV